MNFEFVYIGKNVIHIYYAKKWVSGIINIIIMPKNAIVLLVKIKETETRKINKG